MNALQLQASRVDLANRLFDLATSATSNTSYFAVVCPLGGMMIGGKVRRRLRPSLHPYSCPIKLYALAANHHRLFDCYIAHAMCMCIVHLSKVKCM
jgi:hypothetical protein